MLRMADLILIYIRLLQGAGEFLFTAIKPNFFDQGLVFILHSMKMPRFPSQKDEKC